MVSARSVHEEELHMKRKLYAMFGTAVTAATMTAILIAPAAEFAWPMRRFY